MFISVTMNTDMHHLAAIVVLMCCPVLAMLTVMLMCGESE